VRLVTHYEPLADAPASHVTAAASTTTDPDLVNCRICLRMMRSANPDLEEWGRKVFSGWESKTPTDIMADINTLLFGTKTHR